MNYEENQRSDEDRPKSVLEVTVEEGWKKIEDLT